MSVMVTMECDGCDAKADPVRLNRSFKAFNGRFGFGVNVTDTIDDVTPDGWVPFDGATFCTYCPECWADIEASFGEKEQESGG